MSPCVGQVLEAQNRRAPAPAPKPRLLIAGAGGALGGEVTRRLVGVGGWRPVTVLTREPMRVALTGVRVQNVADWGVDPAAWPTLGDGVAEDVAVIMFEPPRSFHQRERALWTPTPDQLPALAHWLRGLGVRRLAVLVPHAAGGLPNALKHGLANLDEYAVASQHFDCLLWLRTAKSGNWGGAKGVLPRIAAWMLGTLKYMVPDSQRPLRAVEMAAVLHVALQTAPPGVHVLAPELLREAARGEAREVLESAWPARQAPVGTI